MGGTGAASTGGTGPTNTGGTGTSTGGSTPEDCPDPGQVCVVTPVGWDGPAVLYDGPDDAMTQCPATSPDLVLQAASGLVDEPAACAPCTCTAASVYCQGHGFTPYGNVTCNAAVGWSSGGVMGNSCGSLSASGVQGIILNATTVDVTGCMPGGGTATIPPAKWGASVLMCTNADASTCTSGVGRCVNPAVAPWESGVCVFHEGDVECPAGFPNRHVLATKGEEVDTRGCSACACPQSFSCNPTFRFYSAANCSGLVIASNQANTCIALGAAANLNSYDVDWNAVSGSCPSAGGQPTGQIVPGNSITSCCQ